MISYFSDKISFAISLSDRQIERMERFVNTPPQRRRHADIANFFTWTRSPQGDSFWSYACHCEEKPLPDEFLNAIQQIIMDYKIFSPLHNQNKRK